MAVRLTDRPAPAPLARDGSAPPGPSASAEHQAGTFERAWQRAGFQIIHANILHPLGLIVEGPDGPAPVAALPAWAETAAPAVRDELLRGVRDAWELAGRADLLGALLYAVGLEVRATAAVAGQQVAVRSVRRRGAWGRWRTNRPR